MPIKLKRVFPHPILKPVAAHKWEAAAVFNCAAIYYVMMDLGKIIAPAYAGTLFWSGYDL